MLFIGEEVGTGEGPEVDIALDPLEGTTLTAKDMPNALAVIAMGPRGSMLHAPDVYMDKLAVGPGYPPGVVSIDRSPADNVRALARAKGVSPQEVIACVLDRPRHEALIAELRAVGVHGALGLAGQRRGRGRRVAGDPAMTPTHVVAPTQPPPDGGGGGGGGGPGVGDYLSDPIGSAAASAFSSAMQAVWDSAVWLLKGGFELADTVSQVSPVL